jgi:hypothetical protein
MVVNLAKYLPNSGRGLPICVYLSQQNVAELELVAIIFNLQQADSLVTQRFAYEDRGALHLDVSVLMNPPQSETVLVVGIGHCERVCAGASYVDGMRCCKRQRFVRAPFVVTFHEFIKTSLLLP